MRRPTPKPAFVLVMVLAVLVLVGTFLAVAVRHGCRKASEAGMAARDLQVRWGALSCRSFVLPAAEDILKAEAEQGTPVASARRTVTLGGVNFLLIVGDEQAKVSVNGLVARYGPDITAVRLQSLFPAGRKTVSVALRSSVAAGGGMAGGTPPTFTSLDQVFAYDRPARLVAADAGVPATGRITCWSDGKINFRRAEAAVIGVALQGSAAEGLADRLVAYRMQTPDGTLAQALAQLEVTPPEAAAVQAFLTETSACHSVWVIASDSTRQWYGLYVEQGAADVGAAPPPWMAFQWWQ